MKNNNTKHPLVKEIIFTSLQIQKGILKISKQINKEYKDIEGPILILGILKGCGPFMFELIKHLTFDLKIDFMIVSSYFGGLVKKTKNPKIVLDIDYDIENHNVIVVEDIIESGNTIWNIKKHLKNKNIKSIKIVSLLYKKIKNTIIKPDFYVFDAPKKFLVGFGLDYKEKLRNLNYIGEFNQKK